MEKKNICFIGDNPEFNGGISLFKRNLVNYIEAKKIQTNISWIYRGKENRKYEKDNVNYIEIKTPKITFVEDLIFNHKISRFLKNNDFDIINSHAIWGYWMKDYKKKEKQKIIHTYHGSTYYFLKNSLERFGIIKGIIMLPLLLFGYFIEKPPIKKADSIICVSEKVKRQIEKLYEKRLNVDVVRTGVNLSEFKIRDKLKSKKELNLDSDKGYGLYIGGGGYWTKGLDRAINLSEQINKLNSNYRLIVIGSDYNKVEHLLNKDFIIFLKNIPRKDIPLYYSASDIFFCLSRYEGGAPTLVTSEAMASGCLLVCSKDSEQEIIEHNKNGLIIENFDKKDAENVYKTLKDKTKREKIIKNSKNTIKEFSIDKWGEKYLNVLLERN